MKVSIRAEYPLVGKRDWYTSIEPFHSIGSIELAFHSPENFSRFMKTDADRESVLFAIRKLNLKVPTIHMAHASLNNMKLFMTVFVGTMKIARALDCHDIVIHPNNGVLSNFEVVLKYAIFPLLEEFDCNFLWETFPGKRRILTAFEPLAMFCARHERNYICYDVVHMQRHSTKEVIMDIGTYYPAIKSFHFSNWQSKPFQMHLPIRDGILDYNSIMNELIKLDFQGNITLEYLPHLHNQLVSDGLSLLRKLYEREKVK